MKEGKSMNNQPQPPESPQPVPPVQQPAPAATPSMQQPAMPPQMPVKKGLSKGVLWGIIGGSIGFFLLIIAVVVVLILNIGPSKDDYRQAISWINKDSSELNGFRSSSSMRNPEAYKETVNRVIKSRDELNDKLSKSRIMRDKDVREAYDKYKKAYDVAKPEIESLSQYVDVYSKVSKKCDNIFYFGYISRKPDEVDKEVDQKYGDCTSFLQQLSKSENSNIASYGKEWSDYYASLKKYYVGYSRAYADGNFSARPSRPTRPSTTGYTLISNAGRKINDSGMDRYFNDFSSIVNQKLAAMR